MHPNIRLFRLPLAARYAIQGMLYLAREADAGTYCLLDEVAGVEKLPRHFLSKIFQDLTQAGLLESRRGRGGGYTLARSAGKISLMEIILSIQDPFPEQSQCALTSGSCTNSQPCVLHGSVVAWEGLIKKRLEDTTLMEAVRERNITSEAIQ